MIKIIKGALVGAALLIAPVAALASTNLTFLTVDGLANTSVNVGDSIDAKVTYAVTSNDDVESLDWELVGSGLPPQCVDIPDQINTGTFHPSFEMNTDGATGGTFDVKVRLYGVNGSGTDQLCGSTPNDTMTFTNRVAITEDGNSTGVGSGTGNTGNGTGSGSVMPAWFQAWISGPFAAILAALKPTTAPAPTQEALCTQLPPGSNVWSLQTFLMTPTLGGQAAVFNQAGVYAPTGYLGPITLQALSNFKYAHHCN